MFGVALSLGLVGSLHCVGMCGPLALAFCARDEGSLWTRLYTASTYNLGRTLTYALLGGLFGYLGEMSLLVDMQKGLSILLGAVLVISFLLSIDIEQALYRLQPLQKFYKLVRSGISAFIKRSAQHPPILLGLLNGLLPCGLVYVALAGALASAHTWAGMIFMFCFGLGTIPMMLAVVLGYDYIPRRAKATLTKALPLATLGLGLFLIYRGVAIDRPIELDFWYAVKHPIMCH